ncbi:MULTISPECIES: hypothetical protein [unclassified Streptomyces]|uniref:hypothetical protein n=1 Tax=unclassified Streptomyces TaxID=2593676 RepID=UPI0033E0B65E
MTTPTNPVPRSIADLDPPLAALDRDLWLLAVRRRGTWLAEHPAEAEQEHAVDQVDKSWADLAATHPEACSTPASYPEWSAALAARIADDERARGGAA